MPVISASAKKPPTRMSDTRFEIVMVKRSLDAANAIIAGNSSSLNASRTMAEPTGFNNEPSAGGGAGF